MEQILIKTFLFCISTYSITADLTGNDANADANLKSPEGPICVTSGCVKAAAVVIQNMDETVNPCDDFYQFACGGFIREHVIPDDKSRVNVFNIVGDKILERLRTVLEEPSTPDELKPFALVKKYYAICTNTTQIERNGLKNIKDLLGELGGWPAVAGQSWKEYGFDWQQTTYDFREKGLDTNSIFKTYVSENVHNSSQRIIDIDQADLGLEREYLIQGFDNEVVKAYYDYIVEAAVILGADKETASKEIKESVEFEMKLANISLPKEERRNASLLTNLMTVSELQDRFPSIPWQEYLNRMVGVVEVLVCPHDVVDVGVPNYIAELEQILKETPKRVQANYLFSQNVLNSVTYLTKELRDSEQKFTAIQEGTQSMKARWKECTTLAATKLGLAADALYARRYFSDSAKKSAEELVRNLRTTFMNMLKDVDWMDESTRKIALEKAQVMEAHVAYPNELLDDKKLEAYYAALKPTRNDFLEFSLTIDKFDEDLSYKRLPQVVNKTEWTEHSHVTTVNAFYNTVENSIELPAGILQGVLFDHERPNYMNYGSIGFAIGHEITHGFDDQGRQYDKDGNLKDWWAPKTNDAFVEKAQCIIDQYGNQTAKEVNLNLNGINTQGENIADNGGVKEAYLAYNLWAKRNGDEPRLPGLNYSQRQLFWISSANVWCTNQRTEFLRQQVLIDPHSPPNFRVIVPLSNSEYFARDFNCPVGSNMNPQHKCGVW